MRVPNSILEMVCGHIILHQMCRTYVKKKDNFFAMLRSLFMDLVT